jgi:hypothetical protein
MQQKDFYKSNTPLTQSQIQDLEQKVDILEQTSGGGSGGSTNASDIIIDGTFTPQNSTILAGQTVKRGLEEAQGQIATKANDADVVHKTGDETINNLKTFIIYPQKNATTYVAPTLDNELVPKKYVDDAISTENTWDRTSNTLTPHNVGDIVDVGSGGLKGQNVSTPVQLGDSTNNVFNTINQSIIGAVNEKQNAVKQEPQGFEDAINEVSLSFNDSTRTLTINKLLSSYTFFANGKKFIKTINDTVVISNTQGNHFIYYDDNGTLQDTTIWTDDIILKYCYVAFIYWDATNNVSLCGGQFETHGAKLGGTFHLQQHLTVGTRYEQGLGLDMNVDLDGSSLTHIQVSGSAGIIWDEDLKINIFSRSLSDNIQILYKQGVSANWIQDYTTSAIVKTTGSGRASYNQFTSGAWQLTEISNGNYGIMYIAVIPSIISAKRWIAIMGENEYNTLNNARNASAIAPNFGILPFQEIKIVGAVIFQTSSSYTNAVKSRIRSLDTNTKYFDWRATPSVASFSSASHNNLSGLQGGASGEFYHLNQTDYNNVQNLNTNLNLKEDKANKVTEWSATTTNTNYPSEKLTKDNLDLKENLSNKNANNGYVGLTNYKITLKNALGTITSFFQNSNTSARTYTFQDRDGTIVDNTDLATKIDKPATATENNIAIFDANKNVVDSGFNKSVLGIIDGEVNTFADLPTASTHNGEIWLVKTTTGVVFINQKVAGFYTSNGTIWTVIVPINIDGYQVLISSATANRVVIVDANGQVQQSSQLITDLLSKVIANQINSLTAKTTPSDNDVMIAEDSANSWGKIKFTMLGLSNYFSSKAIVTKTYYVSQNGDDANNGLSLLTPVQTLARALTLSGNTGNQIVVLPGTYSESGTTITAQNVTITAANLETGGIVNFTQSITINNPASTVRINGLSLTTLNITGAGSVLAENLTINTALNISANNYARFYNCDTQGGSLTGTVNITGAGIKIFAGKKSTVGTFTLNNSSAVATIDSCQSSAPITVTAGTLSVGTTLVYAVNSSFNAIAVSSGAVLYLTNVTCRNSNDNTLAKINLASGSLFGKANSEYALNSVNNATELSRNAHFDEITANNVNVLALTASQLIATDSNKRLQTLSTTTYPSLTELSYIKGLTSSAQTQINSKQSLDAIGTDIASASTINLTNATGNTVNITGTTTITAITLSAGTRRVVKFTGILTLTNSANLILPSGENITTAVGDYAEFVGYSSNVVACYTYTRANGTALITGAGVLTFNSRSGNVVPATNDYSFSQLSGSIATTQLPNGGVNGNSQLIQADSNGNIALANLNNISSIVTVTTDTTLSTPTAFTTIVLVNASSPVTITMPTAIGYSKYIWIIKNIGTAAVGVAPFSSQNIDGSSSISLSNQYQFATLISNGANMNIISQSQAISPTSSVAAIVGQNIAVTLGNLSVRFNSGAVEIKSVTSSMNVATQSWQSLTASVTATYPNQITYNPLTTSTWQTLANASGLANSGALVNGRVVDLTNSIIYDVQVSVGAGYNNNTITINKR